MTEPFDSAADNQQAQSNAASDASTDESVSVKSVDFPELSEPAEVGPGGSLGHLMDVKFEMEAMLGRTVLPIEDILQLGSGSIVHLDRMISEPVELSIQGVKVAEGEVVVVDDRFAIRIKSITKPAAPGF